MPIIQQPGQRNYKTDRERLSELRAYNEKLAEQSLVPQQGGLVSGHYVGPTIGTAILQGLTGYLAGKNRKKLGEEAQKLEQDFSRDQKTALSEYLTLAQGGQRETPVFGPSETGEALPPHIEQVRANPRQALIEALSSQFPAVNALGQASLKTQKPEGLTQKDLLGLSGYNPESKVQAALKNDPSLLRGEGRTHVIDGQLVRENSDNTNPRVLGDFASRFGSVGSLGQRPDGTPIIGQLDQRTGKASFAPQGSTVNVATGNKAETAFSVGLNKDVVERLTAGKTAADKAVIGLSTFANAATQIKDATSGIAANPILAGKKIVSLLTGKDDPTITSTEQVSAALGQAVLDNAKALGSGTGFSNTDREFLEKIVLGKITLDKPTLERAVNLGIATNLNILRNQSVMVERLKKNRPDDAEILENYATQIPEFSLDADQFDFDPRSNRFNVKTSQGKTASPLPQSVTGDQVQRKLPLDSTERQEYERLRAKHGKSK